MIKNKRQYLITKAAMQQFRKALIEFEKNHGFETNLLIKAEYEGLKSQYEELSNEVSLYEELVNNKHKVFSIYSIDDLPIVLISARIAQNLSQKELAEKLGLKEQQIQRYEGSDYSTASFERIMEICKVLNVGFDSKIFIQHKTSIETIFQKLTKLGFEKNFILSKLLPQSILDKFELFKENKIKENDVVLYTAHFLSRLLGWDINSILSPEMELSFHYASPRIQYKLKKNVDRQKISAQSFVFLILAKHIINQYPIKSIYSEELTAKTVRTQIIAQYGSITFINTLNYVWSLGIPVVPIRNNNSFHGACIRINGRNLIILSQNTNYEARLLFDLLHELFHALNNLSEKDFAIYEELHTETEWQNNDEEIMANKFAGDVLLEGRAELLADLCVKEANGKVSHLKSTVKRVAEKEGYSISSLANYMAYRLSRQGINWWGAASNLQSVSEISWSNMLNLFFNSIEINKIEEPFQSTILRILKEE